MFFSIAAIANQQVDSGITPIPGENSFGNAYTGTPKEVLTAPLVALGQTNVMSYIGPTIEVQKFSQVQDSLGVNFPGYYLKNTSPEVNLFKNYSINLRSENGVRYASNTTWSLLEEELLPPSFVVPDGINFYPYIFCASRSSRRLEQTRFVGSANYVEIYGYSTQYVIPLNIRLEEGVVQYVGKSSKESLNFINNFYDLVDTGVRYVGNSSKEI